jgi:multiple sugar transport system permease protein
MSVTTLPGSLRDARGRAPVTRHWARRELVSFIKRASFYFGVFVVVAVALFPFYWILRTSLLSDANVAQGVGGSNGLVPLHLTLGAYWNDFTQQHFLTPLVNSAIVALGSTLVTVVVASMAGYALARLHLRGAGAILGFILLA